MGRLWIMLALCVGAIVFYLLYKRDMLERTSTQQLAQATLSELAQETKLYRKEALATINITHPNFQRLLQELRYEIVGMDAYLNGLCVALLVHGHVLVEGVPGLAKTKTITLLARLLDLTFHRIQFTPDMLPGDIVGNEIYDPKLQQFVVMQGPLFAHCILADEINRTTPKVQSALLEAMQEGQVTIAGKTFPLPRPFFVLATQNPLEHEGTFPLPEAQIDRFFLQLLVDYPLSEHEQQIVKRQQHPLDIDHVASVFSHADLLKFQREVGAIHVDDDLIAYAVRLVQTTRSAEVFRLGASPRASLALISGAKAIAWLRGASEVSIEDVQAIALPVLRHRVLLRYDLTQRHTADDLLVQVLVHVPIQ